MVNGWQRMMNGWRQAENVQRPIPLIIAKTVVKRKGAKPVPHEIRGTAERPDGLKFLHVMERKNDFPAGFSSHRSLTVNVSSVKIRR